MIRSPNARCSCVMVSGTRPTGHLCFRCKASRSDTLSGRISVERAIRLMFRMTGVQIVVDFLLHRLPHDFPASLAIYSCYRLVTARTYFCLHNFPLFPQRVAPFHVNRYNFIISGNLGIVNLKQRTGSHLWKSGPRFRFWLYMDKSMPKLMIQNFHEFFSGDRLTLQQVLRQFI